jgi:murein hydrolase activator
MLTHGDFTTVYCNFANVSVSAGQRVEPGAVLGQAGAQDQPLGAGLWFGLFEKGRPQDPAAWLARR